MIGTRSSALAGMFPGVPASAAPPIALAPGTGAGMPTIAFPVPQPAPPASAAAPAAEPQGFGSKFSSWLHAPGTAGALLRGAAASFNGDGIGGAIDAAARYSDQTKTAATAKAQQDFANQMAVLRQHVEQQQVDQTGDYQTGQLTNDALRIGETGRSNRAREGIDANGQRIQVYGIDTGAATARRGQDVSLTTNAEDNATSRANNAATVGASVYGTNVNYLSDGQRATAGIGSRAAGQGYTETKTTTPGDNPWFGEATLPTVTTTRVPIAPPGATAAPATGGGAPPAQAIAALRANPALRGQFEAHYGTGSAGQFLGGR